MSSFLVRLPRAFPARYGVPVITGIDARIFGVRYFTHCLRCTYCHDQCCDHGVDIDAYHVQSIDRVADALEAFTKIPRRHWFTKRVEIDAEQPGGSARRTRVRGGRCVFLHREKRGCLIHAFALERGFDFRELKSLVDCLFPITFAEGVLYPADEALDGSLVCSDTGPTLYRGLRDELRYYFGEDFVDLLDQLEASRGIQLSARRSRLLQRGRSRG